MQNIAQIADELGDFDDLVQCCVCKAHKYIAEWTRCRTCDTPFPLHGAHASCSHQDYDNVIGRSDTPSLVTVQRTGFLVERKDRTTTDTRNILYITQKHIAGSRPILVDVDYQRWSKMDELSKVSGFGENDSGKEVCMKEFQYLLLGAGYSEGSWKHHGTCDKNCNRLCAGTCRNDGNPHTYPRFMGMFFDNRVVQTKGDFFMDGVKENAMRFAGSEGLKRAKASKKWDAVDINGVFVMDENGRNALISKYTQNIMHGFDDYLELCKAHEAEPRAFTTWCFYHANECKHVVIGEPCSPSLQHNCEFTA